jgi:hypothetical protein
MACQIEGLSMAELPVSEIEVPRLYIASNLRKNDVKKSRIDNKNLKQSQKSDGHGFKEIGSS